MIRIGIRFIRLICCCIKLLLLEYVERLVRHVGVKF